MMITAINGEPISAPSLTRLRNRGLVAAVGKKLDTRTGRKVTVYRRMI